MITQRIGASTGLAPRHIVPLPITIPAPAIVAMVGALITLVGSALPWVTIFRGTQTLTGWNGSPRYLAGLAVASVALTVLFLWAGRPAAFRRLAVLAGSTAVLLNWGTVAQVDTLALLFALAAFYQYSRYEVDGE